MTKILAIDDDPLMCTLVARILGSAGHAVLEAKDGYEGLRLFRTENPALVITDILMPDKEGIETIRELRATSTVPIIAISGDSYGSYDAAIFLDAAQKLGADAIMTKPFRAEELIATVSRLLRREPPAATSAPPDLDREVPALRRRS